MIPVGQPQHPINTPRPHGPSLRHVEIACGQRLSAMSLDSSKITSREEGIYSAGEIVFAIDTGIVAKVTILDSPGQIEIVEHQDSRALLIRHGVGLMRSALDVNDGVRIEVDMPRHVPHCGLGTSSLMVNIVGIALNELYGNPIDDVILARYLAQNHGEEIADNSSTLKPVQCLGGAGVANLFPGSLQVLAGQTTIIATMSLPENYRAVIGIPRDRNSSTADVGQLMDAEDAQEKGFTETGRRYSSRVAYDLVHEGLPGMATGDLTGIGKIIFNHRFNWGSIRNCSFSHPRLIEIADGLRPLWEQGIVPILGLSSAGPAFYAITEDVDRCVHAFHEQGLETFTAPMFNQRYGVIQKQDYYPNMSMSIANNT